MGFLPRIKCWINIRKSNVIYHINKMKEKNNHLKDAGRQLDKIQYTVITKFLNKLEIEVYFLISTKGIYEKPYT